MNMKHEFPETADGNVVYVRRVDMTELPDEVRDQVPDLDSLYAVHGVNGERLALVRDRNLAFVLARQNELEPVSVH